MDLSTIGGGLSGRELFQWTRGYEDAAFGVPPRSNDWAYQQGYACGAN